MLLLSAVLMLAMQTADASHGRVVLRIDGRCTLPADGRRIPAGQLGIRAKQWESDRREIELRPTKHVSADCFSNVIASLVSAQVSRLGFIGNEVAPEKPL